ncbi:MAG: hypothetical protein ACJAUV_001498 [Flavobacteriales bacterium]|jgi:hypothetical protein
MKELNIKTLVKLGEWFEILATHQEFPGISCGLTQKEFDAFLQIKDYAHMSNAWFTQDQINIALLGWSASLKKEHVEKWLNSYTFQETDKTVGLITAGNIPLVGLHDLLTSLMAGYSVKIKLSKDDSYLMRGVIKLLILLNPAFEEKIYEVIDERLTGFDVVIATGSNNTARYFDYYFGKYPNVIRKNRHAIAVVSENDTNETLKPLGKDIFTFFGLGCRNVSKIYIPKGFNKDWFFEAMYEHKEIVNHHKYANNYDYHKAIYLMNQDKILDNGFLLIKEDSNLTAPVGVVFYEEYESKEAIDKLITDNHDQIQCVVGNSYIPFGQAQNPMLWDYADGVDTMKFLSEL